MSEAPKKPTSQDCNNENINLQLKAGGVQYLIHQYQKELVLLNDRMRDLAIEYNKLKAQEESEAKLRAEIEANVKEQAKPKLEVVPAAVQTKKPKKSKDQSPTSEVNQASTQAGSETAPTSSQAGPVEQGNKKE